MIDHVINYFITHFLYALYGFQKACKTNTLTALANEKFLNITAGMISASKAPKNVFQEIPEAASYGYFWLNFNNL